MHTTAMRLVKCFAIGLGKNEDYFNSWFEKECSSVFRAIHYNPREGNFDNQKEETRLSAEHFKLVTPEHTDSGFLTLLSTFMYPGLQVLIDGEYKSI